MCTHAASGRLLGLVGMLTVVLSLASCGGGTSSTVVARVEGHAITKATLDRWTAIEGVLSYQFDPTGPVPKGVVPDPPAYTACVAYLQGHPQGGTKLTVMQLRTECRGRYEVLQHHTLEILITNYWTSGEGAERGLSVTAPELKQALKAQFPTPVAQHRFLQLTGEREADDLLDLTTNIMTGKIQRAVAGGKVSAGSGNSRAFAQFLQDYPKKWRPRTTCLPGYVVSQCKEYPGPVAG